MKRSTTAVLAVALALVCLRPHAARAWHGPGHARATRLAVRALPAEMPAFFRRGADRIAHCSKDPDLFKRPLAEGDLHRTEFPEHFLDLQRLGGKTLPAHRFDLLAWAVRHHMTPREVGLVPYAVVEWTQRLAVAFAEHRRWPGNPHVRAKALVYAGLLAHYAQDVCQPLHTTIHFDGRAKAAGTSPHSRIHRKFDELLEKLPPAPPTEMEGPAVQPFEDLRAGVRAAQDAAHALLDRVYDLEARIPAYREPLPAEGPVADFNRKRLRAAARFTARLYATAWADSASVRIPKWHDRSRPAAAGAGDDAASSPARDGQDGRCLRIGTWNVEHFMRLYDQELLPERSRNRTELFRDDEDLYEVAATPRLKHFDPDILVIQACCSQEMLERFNADRLDGAYAFVKVFPGNGRGHWLAMLAKPGFNPLETRAEYYKETDPVRDPEVRGPKEYAGLWQANRLFPRGPAFVRFCTPAGHTLWVGTTHAKSKYGNNEAVTRWRLRQVRRTRDICRELLRETDTDRLVTLGDFNDGFGRDRYEQSLGDALAVMLEGDGEPPLRSPTRDLARRRPDSASYVLGFLRAIV